MNNINHDELCSKYLELLDKVDNDGFCFDLGIYKNLRSCKYDISLLEKFEKIKNDLLECLNFLDRDRLIELVSIGSVNNIDIEKAATKVLSSNLKIN